MLIPSSMEHLLPIVFRLEEVADLCIPTTGRLGGGARPSEARSSDLESKGNSEDTWLRGDKCAFVEWLISAASARVIYPRAYGVNERKRRTSQSPKDQSNGPGWGLTRDSPQLFRSLNLTGRWGNKFPCCQRSRIAGAPKTNKWWHIGPVVGPITNRHVQTPRSPRSPKWPRWHHITWVTWLTWHKRPSRPSLRSFWRLDDGSACRVRVPDREP